MTDLLIKNAYIITMNENFDIIQDGAVYIENDVILDVGPTTELKKRRNSNNSIDATNKILFPGLVNSHTHLEQTILRGLIEDSNLSNWLEPIYWLRNYASMEEARISSLLGCIEAIKTGCTCILSHQSTKHDVIGVKTLEEIGLRGTIARFISNYAETDNAYIEDVDESVENSIKFIEKYDRHSNGRIRCIFGPIGYPYVFPETWKKMHKYSKEYQIGIHSHISENIDVVKEFKNKRTTDIKELYKLGVLDNQVSLAHGIFLTEYDIQILRNTKTNIVHCPCSNMKLGIGIAPVDKIMKNGVRVAIGSDGAPSNNSLNILQEAKMMCLSQKVTANDPSILPIPEVFKMIIENGYIVTGFKQIGTIKEGNRADMVLIDMKHFHFYPRKGIVSNLIYGGIGANVDSVIINGQLVMSDGKINTINEENVLKKAVRIEEKLIERIPKNILRM